MGEAFRDIGTLFTLAYGDAMRLVRTMWRVIGLMLLLIFVAAIPGALLASVLRTPLSRELVGTLSAVAGLWLAAPYSVALYRFVLTGAVLAPESLRRTDAAQRFFAWSAMITFIVSLPSYAYAILGREGPVYAGTGTPPVNVPQTLITFALMIATWIFATRAITLLPAVAMDRPVDLRQALAQTRGRFWFIVGATVAAVLPFGFASAILQIVVSASLGKSIGAFVSVLIAVATVLFIVQIGISLSARIYEKLSPPTDAADQI